MSSGKANFTINQGETFYIRLGYSDASNTPIDLSGYSGKMQLRDKAHGTIFCTLSTESFDTGAYLTFSPNVNNAPLLPINGFIGINISAYKNLQFTFSECYYDLFIYTGSGTTLYSDKILEGKIKLNPAITEI
jgi:hypothetical protein